MAKDDISRSKFVDSCIRFMKKFDFEGMDLAWEYPGRRGGDPDIDKQDFNLLVFDLKAAMSLDNLILVVTITAAYDKVDISYDLPTISQYTDYINVMTYNYHGDWET